MKESEAIALLENVFCKFNKEKFQSSLHDIFATTDASFNVKIYSFISEFLIGIEDNTNKDLLSYLKNKYELPIDKWLSTCSMKEFASLFFQTGIFISIVSDAIELSFEDRKSKWERELTKWNEDREYQMQISERQRIYLEKLRNCRKQNEIAYQLLTEEFPSLLREREEWSSVLMNSYEQLKTWNKVSWTCVRIDSLHPLQKRAVVHKIESFEKMYGTTHLPENMRYRCMHANWSLLDEEVVDRNSFLYTEIEMRKHKYKSRSNGKSNGKMISTKENSPKDETSNEEDASLPKVEISDHKSETTENTNLSKKESANRVIVNGRIKRIHNKTEETQKIEKTTENMVEETIEETKIISERVIVRDKMQKQKKFKFFILCKTLIKKMKLKRSTCQISCNDLNVN